MTVSAKRPQKITKQYLGTQYCTTVSLRNNGSGAESFSLFDWNFRTAEGVEVSASIPFNADKALNTGTLNAGGRTSGQICADSNTTDVTEIVYSPGFGVMHKVTFGP